MSLINVDKIDPQSGTALEIGSSGDTITVPSGATIVNSGTATGFGQSLRPNVNPLIINGDTAVSQRNTSVASITSAGYNTVDRWLLGNTNGGTWTQSQEALTADEAYEDGFSTALKMDCTTADASLGAADNLIIQQRIEAQNLQLLKFGSSTSETLTLGFWVKSTKTGTCIAELYQTDDTRSCSKSYTISSTDTWEYKVLNFPADTTGVIDNNNGIGLTVLFWMAAGTNFTSGTLNTTWGAATSANRAVGQINCADSTSNNFHITGVQLEVGEFTSSTIPSFQHESFGQNLQRCQRYYCTSVPYGTAPTNGLTACCTGFASSYYSGGFYIDPVFFPVNMRTAPTASIVTSENGDAAGMKMSFTRNGSGCGWTYMTANASGTWTDNTFSWNGSSFACGSFSQDETIVTQFNYIMDAEL